MNINIFLLHLELRLCGVTADAPEDEGDLPDADHAVLVRVVPEHKQEKPNSIICRMTMFNVGTTSREWAAGLINSSKHREMMSREEEWRRETELNY